ncbi:MAG TPA: glutathione synthase [Burkholderiaceae bacterium]|nr:glutathione synthase [Burkholderiaceae bacterium]
MPVPANGKDPGRDVLFVVDPLEQLKPAKDSSVAMMRELARRGYALWACTPNELAWESGRVRAAVQRIELLARPQGAGHDRATGGSPWYRLRDTCTRPLAEFRAVLMRKDPPFDAQYLYATHLLGDAARSGARVFNSPEALRDHNEKLAITEFTAFIPPTLVSCDPEQILDFRQAQGEIVVKPLDGMGGRDVFRIGAADPNTNVILETSTLYGSRTVMAQRFIPEIARGDKRILLIAGQAVPYCLARVPKPGESRGNLAAGGTGRVQALSARDRQIAEALGPILDQRGLLLVGLDVIGDYLTEINVTSPTCFVEIHQQSGFDVAGTFVDALERRIGG